MGTKANPTVAVVLMKQVYDKSQKSLLDIELRHLACYHIGCACSSGCGVHHDGAEAAVWWMKAATEVLFDPNKSVGRKSFNFAVTCTVVW